MPTLKLTALRCIRQHDISGDDEPWLYVDNEPAWNGVIDKGETEVLTGNRTDPHPFTDSVALKLIEESNGSGKQIGFIHNVSDNLTNNGLAVFKTSGTHYELEYKVVA